MYLVEHTDGTLGQYLDRPGTARIDVGKRWVELPRELDFMVERWDWEAATIVPVVTGKLARIDRLHIAAWQQDIIGIAHVQKAIEARIMLAGVALDGLVAAEARALAIDPMERARSIVAAATSGYEDAEVARIVARHAARKEVA